jgi:phospholipid-binding lipoprotein MlaA
MGKIRLPLLISITLLAGCSSARNPNDPLEPLNRGIYKFNDTVDKAVIKPVAQGYSAAMPTVGKTMVSNFFSNLDDVVVTANDLLQLKLTQAFSDGMRFFVNSTVGVLGLIDVAATGGLKKHNEDFGQTMGKWGVGNGAYLVLPILGPSTIRDSIGLYADGFTSPTYQIPNMRTRNQTYLVKGTSARAALLDQEKVMDEAIIDRYEFFRDTYLLYRKNLVYDGNPPRARYDDDE